MQAALQLHKPLRKARGDNLKFPLVFYADLRREILKSLRLSAKTQPQLAAEFHGIAYGKIRYVIRSLEAQGKIYRTGKRPFFYTTTKGK